MPNGYNCQIADYLFVTQFTGNSVLLEDLKIKLLRLLLGLVLFVVGEGLKEKWYFPGGQLTWCGDVDVRAPRRLMWVVLVPRPLEDIFSSPHLYCQSTWSHTKRHRGTAHAHPFVLYCGIKAAPARHLYGLLTMCKLKMAEYWTRVFFLVLRGRDGVEVHKLTKKTPIPIYRDQTNLVNKGFIIWLSRKFFLAARTRRVVPSGQGSSIFPARTGFDSSCPLTEIAIYLISTSIAPVSLRDVWNHISPSGKSPSVEISFPVNKHVPRQCYEKDATFSLFSLNCVQQFIWLYAET